VNSEIEISIPVSVSLSSHLTLSSPLFGLTSKKETKKTVKLKVFFESVVKNY